jgi:AcrR family transcriptional regulator
LSTPAENPQRSDAARNREALLAAATEAFAATDGPTPSMRSLARSAGVGVATLYRHFPTREALVDAVYHDQVSRLTRGARDLLADRSPDLALRAWADLFSDWVRTKQGMLDTLLGMIDAGTIAHSGTRDELLTAVDLILDSGHTDGTLRTDATADDVTTALLGILSVTTGRPDQAGHLIDLFIDGLRPGPPRDGSGTAPAM